MLPASGGNLSGGCNSAGSSSYDLTSSGILLEHDFLKIHFIGWSPSGRGEKSHAEVVRCMTRILVSPECYGNFLESIN